MTEDPFLAAWEATLRQRAEEWAIFDAERRPLLRFAEIEMLSRAIERETLQNFEPAEVVALQIGNHPHWPAFLLASLRRKTALLPLEKTMGEAERGQVLQTCRSAGFIASPDGPGERLPNDSPIDWQGRPPALLKLTSGTTAAPRAIRFRSAQLVADARQICLTMGIGARDLNFGIIPFSHSYGFSNIVTALLICGVPFALSHDRTPRALLNDLARTEATIFPGMPVFYQAFGEMADVPALPKLRLCISAGAPLTQNVARKFRQKFGLTIHSFYGSSECGGICYDRAATDEGDGFVGPAMEGVELLPNDQGAAATQIAVRSPAIGDGYFPEEEPAKLGGGVFRPDDLVEMNAAGVRLVGRLSDVINVAGKKVNPLEIEAHLLTFPGVRQAVVFRRASALRYEEVAACVVAEPRTSEAALRDFCRARLSDWQVPKRIYLVAELPANERGKISRRELAAHFAR